MKERSIFLAALEIQDPAARLAYLEAACAGDAVLRGQVEALLQSHQQAGSFLETPVLEQIAATPPAATDATMALRPPRPGQKPSRTASPTAHRSTSCSRPANPVRWAGWRITRCSKSWARARSASC